MAIKMKIFSVIYYAWGSYSEIKNKKVALEEYFSPKDVHHFVKKLKFA